MYIEISKAVRLDSDVYIYVTRLLLCGLSDFVRFSIILYWIYIYVCTAQRVLLVSHKLLYDLVAMQFRFLLLVFLCIMYFLGFG